MTRRYIAYVWLVILASALVLALAAGGRWIWEAVR